MVFPVLELKFSNIVQLPNETDLTATVYRVDDGGLDTNGVQQYIRTKLVQRSLSVNPNVTKGQILAAAQQRLSDLATELGFASPPDRLICTL